ncbi:TPA: hypothetical protein ACU9T0_005594 [Burkholderia cenocepacia]|nr:hypothetical protein [Burkholderia contaminans]
MNARKQKQMSRTERRARQARRISRAERHARQERLRNAVTHERATD